ncbi:MAG TPA: hypothetical protein VF172_08530 [Nitrososphaera sp.]
MEAGHAHTLVRIPLNKIVADEDTSRKQLTDAEKYAKMMRRGDGSPPVNAFGKRHVGDTYKLYNDHRRAIADKILGSKLIPAEVILVNEKDRRGSPEHKQ